MKTTSSEIPPSLGAIRLRIEGRVQGVGFRAWTQQVAIEIGLRGHVRNLEDGAVEIVASGSPPAIDHFRSIVREGPPSAHVTLVTELPHAPISTQSFEIH